MERIEVVDTTPCSCARCVKCCHDNPGWFSPQEAIMAINAGYAKKMMVDWLEPCREVGNDKRIFVLAPASVGYEGGKCPEAVNPIEYLFGWTKGKCTLLENDKCSIHDSGFKPLQCRDGRSCQPRDGELWDNYGVAKLWNTLEGQSAVEVWCKLTEVNISELGA